MAGLIGSNMSNAAICIIVQILSAENGIVSYDITRSTFGSIGPLFADKTGPGSPLLASKSGPGGPGLVAKTRPTGPLFSWSTFHVTGHALYSNTYNARVPRTKFWDYVGHIWKG